jgi:hypothetical protein
VDISIVDGGDTIDLVVPLTGDVDEVKWGLSHIPRNHGFGNEGETSLEAVQEAFKIQHRISAVKVLVLITDEPAVQSNLKPDTVIEELRQREYIVFTVATKDAYYRRMAEINGGVWSEISQNSDLSSILKLFRELAAKVSEVTNEVYKIGGGSVQNYLRLKAPDKKHGKRE